MDINNKNDLEKFYEITIAELNDKAKKCGVEIDELDWYYYPTNVHHMNYYKIKYGLNYVPKQNSKDFYFLRFVTSLFNHHRGTYISKSIKNQHNLAKTTDYFDLSKYRCNFSSEIEYLNHLETTDLNILTDKQKKNISKGVYQTARFLANYNKTEISIPCLVAGSIYGFQLTLASDAIKESGIRDIAKPDIHIKDVLKVLGITQGSDNIDQTYLDNLQIVMNKIAKSKKNVSTYMIDKMIWLICANNPFYLHSRAKKSGNKFKQTYLKKLKCI